MYLGGGTFHDTKSKVGKCFRQLPTPTECEESESDFVYDPESPWGSPVPCRHTRSMGTPPPQLSPSGAAESLAESSKPEDTPPKPKSRRTRKPKCIVVKEKVYKIRQGARQSCKQCGFCKQKFDSQKQLNSHVLGVHSFHFLCKKRTCGRFIGIIDKCTTEKCIPFLWVWIQYCCGITGNVTGILWNTFL